MRSRLAKRDPLPPEGSYAHAHVRFAAVKRDQRDNQKAEEDLLSRLVEPEPDEQRAQFGDDEAAGDRCGRSRRARR